MDIPEAKASTSGHFCVAARSLKFMFVSKMWSLPTIPWLPQLGERSANVNHLFLNCSRHCSPNRQP